MKKSLIIIASIFCFALLILIINSSKSRENRTEILLVQEKPNMSDKVNLTDQEWKEKLTEEEYYVLRKKGTERAFTGKYDKFYEEGNYYCAGCGNLLFTSETKYNSGSGWPSFYQPATDKSVETEKDNTFGMTRIEVHCAKCGGHLGHVFEDGPPPTGLRYCINSVSLRFQKRD